jgi:indoleamine 2,3-dioxygenase
MTQIEKKINALLESKTATTIARFKFISQMGFLCKQMNTKLPERFEFFNELVENLPETKTDGKTFRQLVDNLPNFDSNKHHIFPLSKDEQCTMYSILTMITNRYIWCTGVDDAKNHNVIPKIIAIPLEFISTLLGIAPILTHAAINLWNWHLEPNDEWSCQEIQNWPYNNKSKDITSCLQINNTLTGTSSEIWIYKIMIAIEAISGKSLMLIPIIHKHFDEPETVIIILTLIRDSIKQVVELIKRMYEKCDPVFFFNHLRIYLSDFKNQNLSDGVYFDLYDSKKKYTLSGRFGSIAQSTLLQVYDTLFNVKHVGDCDEFLNEMREYMPIEHRSYLDLIAAQPSLVLFVKKSNNKKIITLFDECVTQLIKFRQTHLALVHAYIMKQSDGTNPVIFCQEMLDDTKAISNLRIVKTTNDFDIQTMILFGVWLILMSSIMGIFYIHCYEYII